MRAAGWCVSETPSASYGSEEICHICPEGRSWLAWSTCGFVECEVHILRVHFTSQPEEALKRLSIYQETTSRTTKIVTDVIAGDRDAGEERTRKVKVLKAR